MRRSCKIFKTILHQLLKCCKCESESWNPYSCWGSERIAFLKMQYILQPKEFILSSSLGKEKEPPLVLSVCQERYFFIQRWDLFNLMANNSCTWYCSSVEFYLNSSIKRMILLRPSFIFY